MAPRRLLMPVHVGLDPYHDPVVATAMMALAEKR
jgi:hypothetical protein